MNRPETDELEDRRRLAQQIVAASPVMPDAAQHVLWLLTRPVAVLKERLAQIATEGRRPDRPGWRERAVAKTLVPSRADVCNAGGGI